MENSQPSHISKIEKVHSEKNSKGIAEQLSDKESMELEEQEHCWFGMKEWISCEMKEGCQTCRFDGIIQ